MQEPPLCFGREQDSRGEAGGVAEAKKNLRVAAESVYKQLDDFTPSNTRGRAVYKGRPFTPDGLK